MRILTLVRTSSALPALPLALGLTVLFYVTDTHRQINYWPYPYAPTLVERPIELMYAVSYAVVSAASAWQGARLKDSGVWRAAPYRPRWRIITPVLSPVVGVGWVMLIVPVVLAFVQRPTWPTLDSLPPLGLGMLLCVAHAIIGFTLGQRLKPVLAVPILSCVVFVLVAYPHSMQPFFLRHIMGEYFGHIGFGETATFASMLALFLPTAGVAAAAAFAWTRFHSVIRAIVAVAVVSASTFAAFSITKDWDYNPSINVGKVETVCAGSDPQVCVPVQASGSLKKIQSEVNGIVAMLREYGVVDSAPKKIEDAIAYGRFTPKNTTDTDYIWLTTAYEKNQVTASVINSFVHFRCEDPKSQEVLTVSMWLEKKMGTTPSYTQIAAEDPYYTRAQHQQITTDVDEISAKTSVEQAAWYRSTVADACEASQ